jgi:aspartyl protease family protein
MQRRFMWLFWIALVGTGVFIADQYQRHQDSVRYTPQTDQSENYREVTIQATKNHHYIFNGEVNGQSVRFLVDTGASSVSIPAHVAERLNLAKGRGYHVQTANGTVMVYQTEIDVLKIGNITLDHVKAHINPNSSSDTILLGMSALKQLHLQQKDSQLILRQY